MEKEPENTAADDVDGAVINDDQTTDGQSEQSSGDKIPDPA